MEMDFKIRKGIEKDLPGIFKLIMELARYEKLLDDFQATLQDYRKYGFSNESIFNFLVAENIERRGQKYLGVALYYFTFSTFTGRPTLWLEDVFVPKEYRGHGIGTAFLRELAKIALEKGCRRMEWIVLDWNKPSIEFYLSLGAKPLSDWTIYRLTVPEIEKIARE
jgi:GNAT superfamily N-acetyltransferase